MIALPWRFSLLLRAGAGEATRHKGLIRVRGGFSEQKTQNW